MPNIPDISPGTRPVPEAPRPLDDLEFNAAHYAGTPIPDLPADPSAALAILTCMDARVDPAAIFGLREGDAHVIRNARGLVTAGAIRSLTISQQAMGTRSIALVRHTRCGMGGLDDDAFLDSIETRFGERPEWTPGGFAEVADSVREGVRALEESPFLEAQDVRGYVYDVDSGVTRRIV